MRQLIVCLLGSLILGSTTPAQTGEYKEYRPEQQRQELFTISFDKKTVRLSVMDNEREVASSYPRSSLKLDSDGTLTADGETIFDETGLTLKGVRRLLDDIHDVQILDGDDMVTVTFYSRTGSSSRLQRYKRGNRVSFTKPIVVDEDEFVRGIVFSVAGDIEIYGEVNRDAVTLLGDIFVGPMAVARGDVATVNGRVDFAREASIYGEIYTAKERRTKDRGRHRYTWDAEFGFADQAALSYDRVDGLYLQEGVRWHDRDSLLPSLWAHGGYAFASERWRYEFGFEQTVLKRLPISISGTFYRRLATEDEWLMGRTENTFEALLGREDYRDYYEVEGAAIGLRSRPWPALTLDFGYHNEENSWLCAHRNLWALFGGDPFDPNFNALDSSRREELITGLTGTSDIGLDAAIEFDTRSKSDPFRHSAWHFTAEAEWSDPDLDSDFDYSRYQLNLRRYQKVHRLATVLTRFVYGTSDGTLPHHKRFYLGGLGSLRGYGYKEFSGTRFWLANVEYRLRFPETDLAVAPIWDVGQIADGTSLSDAEVRHALGLSLYLGDDVRVTLAKRLDRSEDDDIEVYVRLEHLF